MPEKRPSAVFEILTDMFLVMQAEKRPKLKLKLKRIDYVLEALTLVFLTGIWIYTFLTFDSLPEEIPVRYDLQGTADRYAGKQEIWKLPVIATVICLAIFILNRFPHIFNYPREITIQNAERNYSAATRMLRVLNCLCVLVFLVIVFSSAGNRDIGFIIFPVIVLFCFIPVIGLFGIRNE